MDGPRAVRQHREDAGWDCKADTGGEDVTIEPGRRALIDLGFAMDVPVGHVALIVPRSGLAAKFGVTVLNSPGVIDPGYHGRVKACLVNLGDEPFVVHQGDRVAQALFVATEDVVWQLVDGFEDSERGDGGFGSTGVSRRDGRQR